MPLETPEESARATRRISLGCLSLLFIPMGLAAGVAVWSLVSGHGLRTTGWIYILCFILFSASFVQMIRRGRQPRSRP